jgi:hypothetical protein
MNRHRKSGNLALAILLLLLVQSAAAVADGLSAHVSRNEINLGETFQLSIFTDTAQDGDPDFSALEDDFRIVNRSQSNNMQMINGKINRMLRWNLMLQPKRSGQLTIPSISFGSQRTEPITLSVGEAEPAKEAITGDDIFLKVEVDREQAYPGQQILLTVRLYRAVSTESASLSQPQTNDPDILIRKLGEDEQYQSQIKQRRYTVVERRYALFPSRSGRLELAPLRFEGETMLTRRRNNRLFTLPFDSFQQSGKIVRLQSQALEIDILPRPAEAEGQPWLPTSNLQLTESWGKPPVDLKVGEPVTRTLMLFADGLTSAQLPELDTRLPAELKQYPDQPQLQNREDKSGVTGIRQSKIAIVPNRAGRYTLPAITIPWWNVEKGRMERAEIAERTIDVLPAPTAAAAPEPPPTPAAETFTSEQVATTRTPAEPVNERSATAPLNWLLAAGWLLTLLAWGYSAYRGRRKPRQDQTRKPQGTAPTSAEIKAACQRNDPLAAQRALLAWAENQWPGDPPRSLARLAEKLDDEAVASAIADLEGALYAADAPAWRGETLWRQLQKRTPHKPRASSPQVDVLAPLHPG